MASQQLDMTRDRLEKPAVTPHLSLGSLRAVPVHPDPIGEYSPTRADPDPGHPHDSLVLHFGEDLAHSCIFDIGVRQGLQDVLLSSQVLLQVDLDLVVLLQLLLKEFLRRERRI